jgi:LacI family transcriptional regulator
MKKANLKTVAATAGVSVTTASQVLRGAGRISASTADRVLKAAEQLNYIRDNRAASMRSGVSNEIGMVVHHIINPFNAEVISGVSEYLNEQGYFVSVLDSQLENDREFQNLEAFVSHGRSGLIWVPTNTASSKSLEMLVRSQIPTVTFLRQLENSSFDHVGVQNQQATWAATNYLIKEGHRHIAYFGGIDRAQVRTERIAGYQQALADQDIDSQLIWDCADSKSAGLDAAKMLFKEHPEITALVCNGDMVALGACVAVKRMGMTPGNDISVIGFDDISDAAIADPPLSTLGICPRVLGRTLAKVLVERIRHPELPRAITSVAAELILRESTGAIKAVSQK